MSKKSRATKTYLVALAAFTSVLALLHVSGLLSFPDAATLAHMDWNEDGRVHVSEVFELADIGARIVETERGQCLEYYSLKDGMPIKLICSA